MTSQRLRELLKQYGNDPGVANALGISRQAVFQWRKKYGIVASRKSVNPRDIDIFNMYAQGVPIPKIRKITHLSIPHIYRIIRKHKKDISDDC